MATPTDYLPPALSSRQVSQLFVSLKLPEPTAVEYLHVAAQFHSIYLVHFAEDETMQILTQHKDLRVEADGSLVLVLRVSGRHLSRIKTLNEVGVMTWVRENTTIPVPTIIAFDASDHNQLGHEFTLLEKAYGVSVDKIYNTLSEAAKHNLVEQLVGFLIQLHERQWDSGYVGGLVVSDDGKVKGGPIIDEYFWQVPDIEKYWDSAETVESLNPVSPEGFPSYTAFISASVERYVYALEKHNSLTEFRDLIPRLRAFITAISSEENFATLNNVRYILAHKDLHFANIMCDPDDPRGRITAVLDWEFSGVVPAPRWNPARAFLWNAQNNAEAKVEQYALEKVFEEMCRSKGVEYLLEDVKLKDLQEPMQTLTNFLRAIVEVCPRAQAQDRVGKWRSTVEACLEAFGV
jgi:aminoglycoside phosphotransferase (APT) family kinase protein